MLLWTFATVLAVASVDAGAGADVGAAPSTPTAGVIDFTDEEGIAGGEELTGAPLQPLEHESLLPDRYRGRADAGPALVAPAGPRKRGCGGCSTGRGAASASLLLFVALGWRRRAMYGRRLVTAARNRILVVDDSAIQLDLVTEALSGAGFAVTAVRSLGELDDVDAAGAFDLVLMDVQMPELYGDDVATVLRHVRGVKIPIYLHSSLDADELAERANDAGVDGYICKSDGLEQLIVRVTAILGSRAS